MTKMVHLDFRNSSWQALAESLIQFKERILVEGIYAYITPGSSHPVHMIERLIRDLDIEDYTYLCSELEDHQKPEPN